jgi:excisionase family DNA binding protein
LETLLSLDQAAERPGTSERFVRRLIAERRIAYTKLGRHVRIAGRDLDALTPRPGRGWRPAGCVMRRRRFGSVRRLPSGRWQARYRTSDGRQHTAPETFAAKADAARHLAQVETDLSRGQWSDPRLGRTTFAEWAARWEATTVNLRANTRATYRILVHRYLLTAACCLLPTLGRCRWPTWTRWPSGHVLRSWNVTGWGRARG